MRVAIGIPSKDSVKTDFAMSLCNLVEYTVRKEPRMEIVLISEKTAIIEQGRHNIVAKARLLDADHLLFLDSDMTFPADTLLRLYRAGKAIIGCNAARRGDDLGDTAEDIQNPDAPISICRTVGTGVMLISMAVFRELVPPYFQVRWDAEHEVFISEDRVFCSHMGMLHYPIYCHNSLSREIGHIGSKTYKLKGA